MLYPLSYEGGAAGSMWLLGCGGSRIFPMLPEASGSDFDRPRRLPQPPRAVSGG